MSIPPEDKLGLDGTHREQQRFDSGRTSPQPLPLKAEHLEINNKYLSAPFSGPIRSLSPDTLSNISAEEYEAIQIERRGSHAPASDVTPVQPKSRLRQFWIRNLGLAYMLLGQIFGICMNVTTRILEVEGNNGTGFHPFQILSVRMGFTLVFSCVYMWRQKTPDFPLGPKSVRGWLVARGIGGFCGVFGMYYSLLYLPIADATVLTFLSPGIANWACSKLINEPFTRSDMIGTLVSLVGVVFIAKPTTLFPGLGNHSHAPPAAGSGDSSPTNGTAAAVGAPNASEYDKITSSQRLAAVSMAMLGVFGGSTAYVTLRAISTRTHPLITVNYFAAWCFFISIAALIFLPDIGFALPTNLKDWGMLIFLGVCGFTMQTLTAIGLTYEKSSRATNIAYTQMLFALGADKVVFGHSPDIWSIVGSAIIMTSAIVIALKRAPDTAKQAKNDVRGPIEDDESAIALVDHESGHQGPSYDVTDDTPAITTR